ncbi:10 transmembrane domain, possible aa transporter, putative [Perkinsus marinus ATCC 50983]|uniref:10 transmembrane domain, possible aa transporter, putative n=2 Tax=Perkinsus marinus (strain ATCC 50983 / TXsc) TaxID=423536 RepID=C5LD29_PERM5|nr:10 transmembrane domain, possible aa transporter, putative [Perkinsus marinus ATCC 50983]EER05373.1 10 transmembrane domain, possible aa transporter, putative [Perkinsus marinus ATCC 50983]|eukprot:XP_002773557.1 10 transmembrane domain, possible aa transporter, putative [Perkinsus marinus ATCC 50983]
MCPPTEEVKVSDGNRVFVEKSSYRFVNAPSGTVFTCWTALSKTMIGTGMLALAYGFSQCGWLLGFVLLILSAMGASFTLHLLNILAMRSPTRHVSFFTIAEACAPWSRWIVDVAIAVKCMGVGISYIQVSGDTISYAIGVWTNNAIDKDLLRAIVILGVLCLVSPVCFARSISKTVIINILGLLAIAYVVVLAIALANLDSGAVTRVGLPPTATFSSVFSVIPTFIFAFTCHQNILLCAEDLRARTQHKLDIIAVASEAAALVLFVPAIIFPYLTFGESTKSNFVLNYDVANNIAVQVGYLLLGVAEAAAYPLQLFPARKSLSVLLTRAKSVSPRAEFWLRVSLTSFVLVVTAAIAVTVKSLGVTLSFVGIVGSNTICFIMPTFFYCITMYEKGARKPFKWILSVLVFSVTVALLPISLSAVIISLF